MQEVQELLQQAVKSATGHDEVVELTVPDEQFGDFATNVALQLSKKLGQPPREVAEAVVGELAKAPAIADVSIAGPGFINVTLTDKALWQLTQQQPRKQYKDQKVLLEYSCPNAFKELHTGHLYQTIAGDTFGRLLEAAGATVYRANFGGDVGLHVARCLWGMQQLLAEGEPASLDEVPVPERAAWISKAYVLGAQAHEKDPAVDEAIRTINAEVYALHETDDHTSTLAQLYWTTRQWSYDYFKEFYAQLDVSPFDAYYPESSTTQAGVALVKKHLGSVFEQSEGAVVYKGEDAGLHTRVFMTSAGLPTYETKDLGVIVTEYQDFPYDKRILITGNDQTAYMKVVFAALGAIDADLAAKQTHITNGTILFGDGKKMSSRSGNVTKAIEVIETVQKAVTAETDAVRKDITLGAIKYAFLKQRIGGDVAFDVTESVSLTGNSGPYLQYAYARAQSVMRKASNNIGQEYDSAFNTSERSLVRKLSAYAAVVEQAVAELAPHLICTYLYELSQVFNRFYEQNRVIGDAKEADRLVLLGAYTATLKQGLDLLNIPTPEKM